MNEFLKLDIFFFVTTVAVIVLTIASVFVLWRLVRILNNIERLTKQVALESETLRGDIARMRADVLRGKGRLKSLYGFLAKTVKRMTKET